MQQEFPHIFQRMMLRGRGLAIFDDLMTEVADCDLLVPLYTKWTQHSDISSIHVTQNVFHRGSGKYQGDNSTLYLNTKYLILFANPMDISTFHHIARKQDPAHAKELAMLFSQVTKEHCYILCDGHINTPQCLHYWSDLFAKLKGAYVIKGFFNMGKIHWIVKNLKKPVQKSKCNHLQTCAYISFSTGPRDFIQLTMQSRLIKNYAHLIVKMKLMAERCMVNQKDTACLAYWNVRTTSACGVPETSVKTTMSACAE